MRTKVSIITINYNSLGDTVCFLDSLESTLSKTDLDLEVIVVDNNSEVSPRNKLRDYPWVHLIESDRNLGFAGGNNLGVKHSSGEFLFFVNNDTELSLDSLEELVCQYRSNPQYGLLTPLIFNGNGSIQYAGYGNLNPLTGRNKLMVSVDEDSGIRETSFPHGAAMLISKENLGRVGLMSENYFLYYEELDWGNRIKKAALKVGVCLTSTIIHRESASVGKVSECKMYFMTRNRILYARKHFTSIQKFVFLLFFLLVSLPKNVITLLLKRDLKAINTFLAAIHWNLQNDVNSSRLGYKFDHLLK